MDAIEAALGKLGGGVAVLAAQVQAECKARAAEHEMLSVRVDEGDAAVRAALSALGAQAAQAAQAVAAAAERQQGLEQQQVEGAAQLQAQLQAGLDQMCVVVQAKLEAANART